jgi:hypothetical protein
MLTSGARMSLRGEHKYNEMYVSYTPGVGPKSSSYVFRGIFEGSQELQCQISKFVNGNGVSPTLQNSNGLEPNNPFCFTCMHIHRVIRVN